MSENHSKGIRRGPRQKRRDCDLSRTGKRRKEQYPIQGKNHIWGTKDFKKRYIHLESEDNQLGIS